jgi:hypothetical protein
MRIGVPLERVNESPCPRISGVLCHGPFWAITVGKLADGLLFVRRISFIYHIEWQAGFSGYTALVLGLPSLPVQLLAWLVRTTKRRSRKGCGKVKT